MEYLYLKKHKVANKFYLGKTQQDPFKYQGSGVYWQRVLKKYGSDVETVILKECKDNEEVKKWGLYYSQLWNVVDNDLFCNMTVEYGTGGPVWQDRKHSLASRRKMSRKAKLRGNNGVSANGRSEETKQKIRETLSNRPRNEETKQKMRKPRLRASCVACHKEVGINRLTRHTCKELKC